MDTEGGAVDEIVTVMDAHMKVTKEHQSALENHEHRLQNVEQQLAQQTTVVPPLTNTQRARLYASGLFQMPQN